MYRPAAPIAALLALAVPLFGAAPAPRAAPVTYTLAPVCDAGAMTALAVTVRFAADGSGTTRFGWTPEWAGEEHLAQWARDVAVTGATAVTDGADGVRVIRSARAPITVTYRIASAYAADPDVDNSRQPAPVIRPDWFFAVGEAVFAAPEGREAAPARFRWTGPAGIGFASDLQHARPLTVVDVQESVVIGGRDLHVATSGPADRPVRVARIGRYAFDGAAFDALAQRVVAAERGFWRSGDEPFLIAMSPVRNKPGRISYGGTGRSDAFALWVDDTVPVADLTWLLAHENFHTWNPRRLGVPATPVRPAGYWFSEGLTDFYARRLMLEAGLIEPAAFVRLWNEMLARYAASPFRAAPNAEVAARFWTDRAADDMQYQRGALLAARWDAAMRAGGLASGPVTVLRAQAAAFAPRADRPNPPAAVALFGDTARGLGFDPAADIARFVDRGEPVPLAPDAFGRCARVETAETPVFARGYDADRTAAAGNVVTGLDPASPAHEAGLRDGMTILARLEGRPDDATVDYVLKVRDGATERAIRFRPEGRARVTRQRIVLDEAAFARDPAGCRAALAGMRGPLPARPLIG